MKREYSLLATTVLLCWVVAALLASPVHAVSEITTPGSPFPVAATASDEIDPDVIYNATDNEYLLVWENDFYVDHDIVAHRVASDGSLLGSEIAIGASPDHDVNPQLAYNSSANEYLAVWEHEYAAGDHNIVAGRVASDGSLLGSRIAIGASPNHEINPQLAYNSSANEYLVVWEYEYAAGDHDIVARRVASDGSLLGSMIFIGASFAHEINPQLAYNSSANEYLVVWEHDFYVDYDIAGLRVASDGSLLGSMIFIGTSFDHDINPQLAYNPSANEYLVVWEYEYAAGDHNIVARRVASDGSLPGSVFFIAASFDHEINPQVAYTPETYLVVWEHEYAAADHDIVAQWVKNDGSLLGSVIAFGTSPNHDINPRVALNPAEDECLVVWEYEYAAADHDIYGVVPEPHPLMLLVSGAALLALLAYHRQSRRSRRRRI